MNDFPPPLQPIDLSSSSPVSRYLKSIESICPFIEPAGKAGLLFGAVVVPECKSPAEIHPRLFEQLIPLIERFRDLRKNLVEKQHRLLVCHTIVLHMPSELDADTVRALNWPNWLGWALKQFYTPKEIVFGFVRKSIVEKSFVGTPIPPSPFHAVIIRSRVVGSDHRFFTGNQNWLQAMMAADDDGQDVHTPAMGTVPDIRDPNSIREADYFKRVQEWGQKLLPSGFR